MIRSAKERRKDYHEKIRCFYFRKRLPFYETHSRTIKSLPAISPFFQRPTPIPKKNSEYVNCLTETCSTHVFMIYLKKHIMMENDEDEEMANGAIDFEIVTNCTSTKIPPKYVEYLFRPLHCNETRNDYIFPTLLSNYFKLTECCVVCGNIVHQCKKSWTPLCTRCDYRKIILEEALTKRDDWYNLGELVFANISIPWPPQRNQIVTIKLPKCMPTLDQLGTEYLQPCAKKQTWNTHSTLRSIWLYGYAIRVHWTFRKQSPQIPTLKNLSALHCKSKSRSVKINKRWCVIKDHLERLQNDEYLVNLCLSDENSASSFF